MQDMEEQGMDIITANAFIDWDTARRVVLPPWKKDESDVSLRERTKYVNSCFSELQSRTLKALEECELEFPVRIVLSRIYHGWHRGKTPTEDRRAWDDARFQMRALSAKKTSFLPDIRFGDEMLCGGARMPLLDTLRRRDDGRDQQKMVDTSLVSDLLCYSRNESANFRKGRPPKAMAIVIGNDDDLLPGTFAAERWGLPVKVLRVNRDGESRFLNIGKLVYSL